MARICTKKREKNKLKICNFFYFPTIRKDTPNYWGKAYKNCGGIP